MTILSWYKIGWRFHDHFGPNKCLVGLLFTFHLKFLEFACVLLAFKLTLPKLPRILFWLFSNLFVDFLVIFHLSFKVSPENVLLLKHSGPAHTHTHEWMGLKNYHRFSVLPDLAIYRHLGDFLNHLAIKILFWQLLNLAIFWATFQKLSKNLFKSVFSKNSRALM